MDNRLILIALHEIEGIGWRTILKLMSRLDKLQDIVSLSAEGIAAFDIKPQQAQLIADRLNPEFLAQKLQAYENMQIGILTLFDPEYPSLLKETSQPPWVLYYKGSLAALNQPLLGVVGTRTPTTYGKKVAEEMAVSLSHAGFGIVSGLARGIDSFAHRGALLGNGKTIAVLGCAIDRIYPPENLSLYREIEKEGLIVSEYPIGTSMHPGLFPQRNRILAGLSLGVLVVEAAERSGSLITADLALEESRDVFAIPGPITSPKSRGALSLIKQGSKMVTSATDIIEEYAHLIKTTNLNELLPLRPELMLTVDECEILRFISNDPITIDDLLEQSQFTFGHLHSVLLSLLMKKVIEQLPGSTYIKR
jgi:DNA processing protein